MPTLLLTHPDCLLHDMGEGHPERPDRLRAVDKALSAPAFAALKREQAPLADVAVIERLHPPRYVEAIRAASPRHDNPITFRGAPAGPPARLHKCARRIAAAQRPAASEIYRSTCSSSRSSGSLPLRRTAS